VANFDQTSASRAVLIESLNVLGAFRDELVLVGGWVPELLYPNKGHIGSLDVDLAVSPKAVADNAYQTIRKRLADAGYQLQTEPTRFTKEVPGAQEPVKLDLISGQFVGNQKVSSIQVNELRISCLTGIDLAFLAYDEIEIEGRMPDGAQNRVRLRIVRPEGFILIKAFALDERTKDKDAYDVAFILRNYQPNLTILAERLASLFNHELARDGYTILKAKYATIDSVGPIWAARVAQGQGEDYEQARRRAFEDAQELFQQVG
jgi:hypothetical protein